MRAACLTILLLTTIAQAQYDFRNLEFLSNLPASESGIGEVSNDIWGWTDPLTAREYALVGRNSRTVFVDVTDPYQPEYLGFLPSTTGSSTWRDIKVYSDHAYVVSDGNGPHGVQIFDLSRLRGVTNPQSFAPDSLYNGVRSAHNIAINEATGFAYVTNGDILDLSAPLDPIPVGSAAAGTHDSHAVIYQGTDENYNGSEILFSFTGSRVEIIDVSDKSATTNISSINAGDYEHQGWLSTDHQHLFVNAEFDRTWTYVLDVSDLANPTVVGSVQQLRNAYDHNLYVKGDYLYAANYESGLRVFRLNDPSAMDLEEVAHIDTHLGPDELSYAGAWSVYPFFDSGTIIVNDRQHGLYTVRFDFGHGDFDDDGVVGLADLDLLSLNVSSNSADTAFDMNADGLVNAADVETWLAVAGANDYGSGSVYLTGDANLDGVVDVSDFNTWNMHKFTGGTTWGDGDFNSDGVTDVTDFNLWNASRFQSIADAAAVPEPVGMLTLIVGACLLLHQSRNHFS